MTQTLPSPSAPAPESRPRRANGLGITSLILAVLAFVGSFIPFLNFGTGFIAFLAIVFGAIGLFLKQRAKGMAITGLVLGVVALILSIVLATVYTASFAGAVSKSIDEQTQKDAVAAAKKVSVVYKVSGKGKDVSINYMHGTDGMEEANGEKVPWSYKFDDTVGGDFDYKVLNLTATNGYEDKGKLTCSITVDGKVVVKKSSKGPYATVNCDASGFKNN